MTIGTILHALVQPSPHPPTERQARQEGNKDFGDLLDETADMQPDTRSSSGRPVYLRPADQPASIFSRIGRDEKSGECAEDEALPEADETTVPPVVAAPDEQGKTDMPEDHSTSAVPITALLAPAAKAAEQPALGRTKADATTGRADRLAPVVMDPVQLADADVPDAEMQVTSPIDAEKPPVAQPRGPIGREEPPRVTVVASQNFMAPASANLNPTLAGLVEALAGDEGLKQAAFAPALHGEAQHRAAGPAHMLRIELHPAELGAISARLLLTSDQLSVEIRPDTQEGWHRLSSDSETIARAMRDLGFEISKVTVLPPSATATPAPRTDAGGIAGREGSPFQPGASGHEGGSHGERQASGNDAQNDRSPIRTTPSASENTGGGLYI